MMDLDKVYFNSEGIKGNILGMVKLEPEWAANRIQEGAKHFMDFEKFHNVLRVLRSIDRDELEAAGVLKAGDHNQWGVFRRNPFMWLIRAEDWRARKVWEIVKRRLKG